MPAAVQQRPWPRETPQEENVVLGQLQEVETHLLKQIMRIVNTNVQAYIYSLKKSIYTLIWLFLYSSNLLSTIYLQIYNILHIPTTYPVLYGLCQ